MLAQVFPAAAREAELPVVPVDLVAAEVRARSGRTMLFQSISQWIAIQFAVLWVEFEEPQFRGHIVASSRGHLIGSGGRGEPQGREPLGDPLRGLRARAHAEDARVAAEERGAAAGRGSR